MSLTQTLQHPEDTRLVLGVSFADRFVRALVPERADPYVPVIDHLPRTLLRIQRKDNHTRGMFVDHLWPSWDPRAQPEPCDYGWVISKAEFCAFRDRGQFHEWFPSREMRESITRRPSLELIRLTTRVTLLLPNQCLFMWEDVTDCQSIPYEEIL